MNIRVTIHASPGIHLVARCSYAAECRGRGVRGPRMPACVMAALAKLRRFADQELGMIAAVRRMATQTILRNRSVLKHERSSFLSMTLVAQLIDGIGFNLFIAKGTMRIVTAGALDQPLFHRMMGYSARL